MVVPFYDDSTLESMASVSRSYDVDANEVIEYNFAANDLFCRVGYNNSLETIYCHSLNTRSDKKQSTKYHFRIAPQNKLLGYWAWAR